MFFEKTIISSFFPRVSIPENRKHFKINYILDYLLFMSLKCNAQMSRDRFLYVILSFFRRGA